MLLPTVGKGKLKEAAGKRWRPGRLHWLPEQLLIDMVPGADELFVKVNTKTGLPFPPRFTPYVDEWAVADQEGWVAANRPARTPARQPAPTAADWEPPDLNLIERMKAEPKTCYYYTRMPNWASVEAFWDWINADGAFEDDRFRPRQPVKSPSSAAGEAAAATTEGKHHPWAGGLVPKKYQLVIFLVLFNRFKHPGLNAHIGHLFNMSRKSVDRLYGSWVSAIARFFNGQMPPMTRKQYLAATSTEHRSALDIDDECAVVLGDCTERRTEDPSNKDGPLHSALYSDYKHFTSFKVLTIGAPDGYLSDVPPPFIGSTSDNAAHIKARIPKML